MMKRRLLILLLLAVASMVSGCDDDPLAAFEPEIINDADAFQFQVTGAENVTVTRSYTWTNSLTRASIDHSTSRTGGSATVVVSDADGTEVYRSPMKASGTDPSEPGTAGDWTVQVIFTDFDGTANFRVEKL